MTWMRNKISWMSLCLWVSVYQRFEGTHCLHLLSQKSNLLFLICYNHEGKDNSSI